MKFSTLIGIFLLTFVSTSNQTIDSAKVNPVKVDWQLIRIQAEEMETRIKEVDRAKSKLEFYETKQLRDSLLELRGLK